jgi:hypothetical protein
MDPFSAALMGGGKTTAAMNGQTPSGTTVGGRIVAPPEVRDVTDWKTKEVKRFADGNPMKQYVVKVQTTLRDLSNPDDDGVRAIYVKGHNKKRLAQAVVAAGLQTIGVGDELYDTYAGYQGEAKVHEYRVVPGSKEPARDPHHAQLRQFTPAAQPATDVPPF